MNKEEIWKEREIVKKKIAILEDKSKHLLDLFMQLKMEETGALIIMRKKKK